MYGREVGRLQTARCSARSDGGYENQLHPSPPDHRRVGRVRRICRLPPCAHGWFRRHARKKEPVLHETYQYNHAESKASLLSFTDVFELTVTLHRGSEKPTPRSATIGFIELCAHQSRHRNRPWDFGAKELLLPVTTAMVPGVKGKQVGMHALVVKMSPAPSVTNICALSRRLILRFRAFRTPWSQRTCPVLRDLRHRLPGFAGAAVIMSLRAYAFESSRWSESDHPPMNVGQSGQRLGRR